MAPQARNLILMTGAAGRVASRLRPALRDRYQLRMTDLAGLTDPGGDESVAWEPVQPGESFVQGDLTDTTLATHLVAGVSGVVHLAGDPDPGAEWESLLHSNLRATAVLLDAAAAEGVPKLVYASSVHAMGGYNDPATWPVDPQWPPRPCCRYGASKLAGEAMARLYADRVPDASVMVARLGLVTYPMRWRHEARGWLSDSDLMRLVQAALDTDVRYGCYFGVSSSYRPRYDLVNAAKEIGYRPGTMASPDGLPVDPPGYAEGCHLWRIPVATLDAHAMTRSPHSTGDSSTRQRRTRGAAI